MSYDLMINPEENQLCFQTQSRNLNAKKFMCSFGLISNSWGCRLLSGCKLEMEKGPKDGADFGRRFYYLKIAETKSARRRVEKEKTEIWLWLALIRLSLVIFHSQMVSLSPIFPCFVGVKTKEGQRLIILFYGVMVWYNWHLSLSLSHEIDTAEW